MTKLKVADIFCGAGGLSYGFSHSNHFDIVFANDIDADATKSYQLNHQGVAIFNRDIAQLDKNTLKPYQNIDILLGGPPCQSYSTLGKRKMDDRANLFREYLRILGILNPKMFIFENVRGLLSMQNGQLFPFICEEFKKLGYFINYQVLNAVHFGVPQIRDRVILVGTKNNQKFNYPQATHADNDLLSENKQIVSIKDALDDLPVIQSGENGNNKGFRFSANNDFLRFVRKTEQLSEHISPKNNPNLIKIMQTLKDGESKDDLPLEIRPKSGYTNTYAKMWWNKPAPTVTRNFATPSSSRCIHPRDSRALTVREGARLQSFPDDYIFYGSDQSKRLQIGNAVPPLLSIALTQSTEQYFGV